MSAYEEIKSEYAERFPALQMVASRVQLHLVEILKEIPRIDAISARAKDPDRYLAKALKLDENDNYKYSDPRYEVQDQIGARVTVFYLGDVQIIKRAIVKHLRFIEQSAKQPETSSEFGYFGLHFIISTPDDVVPDDVDAEHIPEFFELQIKTLFQHAWSEAHHDLGYKTDRELSPTERRSIAFTAAQAWGADQMFESLSSDNKTNDN